MTPSEMVIFQLRETFPFAERWPARPRYKWPATTTTLRIGDDAVSSAKKTAFPVFRAMESPRMRLDFILLN